jgi:hypothetical protein
MTPWPTKHFTADDLDAFHTEALSSEMRLHLETCEECRQLAVSDRFVLDALGRLESFGPRDDFAERVMVRIEIAKPARVPVLSFPRLTRRRVAVLATVAVGVVASVAWSAANRATLDAWLTGAGAETTRAAWLALRGLAAGVAGQPWFEAIRSALLEPARLAVGGLVGLAIYASGLLALRRLMTPSADTVPHAQA